MLRGVHLFNLMDLSLLLPNLIFFLVEVLIPLDQLMEVSMPLGLLPEMVILPLPLLVEVMMHLALVVEILMMHL